MGRGEAYRGAAGRPAARGTRPDAGERADGPERHAGEAGPIDAIEGQAGPMYIEYVTAGADRVLHQLREVGTTASAVRRLEATGFTRTGRMGDLEWSDGRTDARIRSGSPDGARAPIARRIHEYSFLD